MKTENRKLPPSCPSCGSENAFEACEKDMEQEFRGASFTVSSPCYACRACGFTILMSGQADALRCKTADAYRARNGLLTSDEIIARRRQLGMTQQQFAEYVGVGVASIKRWEGAGVQDRSSDTLLRLRTEADAAPRTPNYQIGSPSFVLDSSDIGCGVGDTALGIDVVLGACWYATGDSAAEATCDAACANEEMENGNVVAFAA